MSDDKELHFGEIIFFDNKKGYGFISWFINEVQQPDLFLHFSDISMEGYKTVYKHNKVSFTLGLNVRNQPKATNVTVLKN